MPLSQSDGTALRAVPSCNSRGCARWREGSSHRGRRCDTRCGRWRTVPRSGWRQKRRLSRHGEASAEPVVRQEGESPCRECCEQHLATAGAMESATGGCRTDRDALQVGTAAREERMHPQPRQRDRRERRYDPTRTTTSGRSHYATVEGFGMRPTGFPSKDTDTHRPSVHAQAREARPAQALTHLAPAPVLIPLPELPPHTAPAPSPLSGIGKDSTMAARIVAGSRRNDPVRSRRRQRVRRRLAAHHAWVASNVRLSVNSLLAWMSLGEVEGATKQVGERSYASADILVCRRQGLNTPCTLLSYGAPIPCWRPRRAGG